MLREIFPSIPLLLFFYDIYLFSYKITFLLFINFKLFPVRRFFNLVRTGRKRKFKKKNVKEFRIIMFLINLNVELHKI